MQRMPEDIRSGVVGAGDAASVPGWSSAKARSRSAPKRPRGGTQTRARALAVEPEAAFGRRQSRATLGAKCSVLQGEVRGILDRALGLHAPPSARFARGLGRYGRNSGEAGAAVTRHPPHASV
jgi:hypothetical protein